MRRRVPGQPTTLVGRIFITLFLLPFLGVGGYVLVTQVLQPLLGHGDRQWPVLAFMAFWCAGFLGIPLTMLILLWRRSGAGVSSTIPQPRSGQAVLPPTTLGTIVPRRTTAAKAPVEDLLPQERGGWLGLVIFGAIFLLMGSLPISFGLRDRESVPVVFGMLFAGVGAVLLVAGGRSRWRRSQVPQVRLHLPGGALVLGRKVDLTWRMEGEGRRIEAMRFDLLLVEQARFTRGTDTYHDQHLVCEQPIAAVPRPGPRGQVAVVVEDDRPPEFLGSDNHLLWVLRCRIEVADRPPIDEHYPIPVHPVRPSQPALRLGGSLNAAPGLHLETPQVDPGGDLHGHVAWDLAQEPRTLALRLVWQTAGKGGEEEETAATVELPRHVRGALAFTGVAPTAPVTWPGTVVALRWMLQVVADGAVVAEHEVMVGDRGSVT